MPTAARCEAAVFKRDTYRRTGRTKSGFELHYREERCKRRAVWDGLCLQHSDMVERGRYVARCRW